MVMILCSNCSHAKHTAQVPTMRIDGKNVPIKIKNKTLKKGETMYRCSENGVLIGKWRDKQDVLYITTVFTN